MNLTATRCRNTAFARGLLLEIRTFRSCKNCLVRYKRGRSNQSQAQKERRIPPICSKADLCQARKPDSHPVPEHHLRPRKSALKLDVPRLHELLNRYGQMRRKSNPTRSRSKHCSRTIPAGRVRCDMKAVFAHQRSKRKRRESKGMRAL